MLTRVRALAKGDRFWIVLSSLASRGSAFLVGMMITRMQGPAALGVYSATLNVAASLTSPFTSALQNNAALLSAPHSSVNGRRLLLALHLPMLLVLMLLGGLGFVALAPRSGLPQPWGEHGGLVMLAAICVLFYQLTNALGQGLLQGVGGFVRPSQGLLWLTLLITVCAVPMISSMGLAGAYGVLTLNSLLPPLLLLWMYVRPKELTGANARHAVEPLSLSLLTRMHGGSWPSVLGACVGAAVSWLCLVFLVNRSHGADGLGWVSLGVQWGTLMLLPVSSWGGVTMKRLIDAVDSRNAVTLGQAVRRQLVQNALVTVLLACAIVLLSPWIAALYKLPAAGLGTLLAVTSGYAVLGAMNNVYERLFFCLNRQGWWMVLTVVSAVLQSVVTWVLIERSYLGVAFGLGAGALCLLGASMWLQGRWQSSEVVAA